jgi:hypothetical protein
MNSDGTTIGSESSSSQASAGILYFYYNQKLAGDGTWQYRTTGGTDTSTNLPPYGSWAVTPCEGCGGYAGEGGIYETYDT